jgi:hypothetical protein
MRLVAIGDTYVRLRVKSEADAKPIKEIMNINNENSLYDGALRACAMLRLRFDENDSAEILHFVTTKDAGPPLRDGLRFWAAGASAGWSGAAVETFLEECSKSPREDVRAAAADAKMKKYRNWRPL